MRRSSAIALIFVSFAIIVILGCGRGRKHPAHVNQSLVEAYQLIDGDRADEAIVHLERQLESRPGDRDYQVALASAFAHKAGIRVQSFVPLVQVTKEKIANARFDLKEDEEATVMVDRNMQRFSRALMKYAHSARVFAAVPSVLQKHRALLVQAIEVLKRIENPRPGDAIYRAALRAILFKHDFSERLVGPLVSKRKTEDASVRCSIDFVRLTDTIGELGGLLIDIYADLAIANPSKAKAHKEASDDVADAVSGLTMAGATIMFVDEASYAFFQHKLIENGFGKVIKCGGSGE